MITLYRLLIFCWISLMEFTVHSDQRVQIDIPANGITTNQHSNDQINLHSAENVVLFDPETLFHHASDQSVDHLRSTISQFLIDSAHLPHDQPIFVSFSKRMPTPTQSIPHQTQSVADIATESHTSETSTSHINHPEEIYEALGADTLASSLHHPDFPHLLDPSPILPTYDATVNQSIYQSYIKDEFLHAWGGYVRDAWGQDDYHPVTRRGSNSYQMSLTAIDSLDTLILMNLTDEANRVIRLVDQSIKFGHQEHVNLFETTIRVLGGLLAAHAQTVNNPLYQSANCSALLASAQSLADHMLFAFDTKSGIPFGTVQLQSHKAYNPNWAGGYSTTAEIASIQLEFQYLSRETNNSIYSDLVDRVMFVIKQSNTPLYAQFFNVENGAMHGSVYTLGARVDSLYEYLLKQYLLSGRSEGRVLMRDMWLDSAQAIVNELVMVIDGDNYAQRYTSDFFTNRTSYASSSTLYVAERHNGANIGKFDHLVCFLPGVYALSVHHGIAPVGRAEEWLFIAAELTKSCVTMYKRASTGLSPEIVQFSNKERQVEQQNLAQQLQAVQDEVDAKIAQAELNFRNSTLHTNETSEEHGEAMREALNEHARLVTSLLDERTVRCQIIENTWREQQPVRPFVWDNGSMHSLLRPETVESLFIMYRVTGHPIYREWGWDIFRSFVHYARVDGGGYSGLHNVNQADIDGARAVHIKQATQSLSHAHPHAHPIVPPIDQLPPFIWNNWNDHMESFFLSETMKYLFLLFSDPSYVNINEWVFNTEAHPLPINKNPSHEPIAAYQRNEKHAIDNPSGSPPSNDQSSDRSTNDESKGQRFVDPDQMWAELADTEQPDNDVIVLED